jgi:ABC-type Fe3+/spermidine/putrescine transport system ATPase subunit
MRGLIAQAGSAARLYERRSAFVAGFMGEAMLF